MLSARVAVKPKAPAVVEASPVAVVAKPKAPAVEKPRSSCSSDPQNTDAFVLTPEEADELYAEARRIEEGKKLNKN